MYLQSNKPVGSEQNTGSRLSPFLAWAVEYKDTVTHWTQHCQQFSNNSHHCWRPTWTLSGESCDILLHQTLSHQGTVNWEKENIFSSNLNLEKIIDFIKILVAHIKRWHIRIFNTIATFKIVSKRPIEGMTSVPRCEFVPFLAPQEVVLRGGRLAALKFFRTEQDDDGRSPIYSCGTNYQNVSCSLCCPHFYLVMKPAQSAGFSRIKKIQ